MDKQPHLRTIKKVWKSIPTLEGAGVRLKRAFGFQDIPLTQNELRTAFDEFQKDTFIKAGSPRK